MNTIEKTIESGALYTGRRIAVLGSQGAERILQRKIEWSALSSYREPDLHNAKISLEQSELREFAGHVQDINKFLKDFLRYKFNLEIADWADIGAGSVILLDDSKLDCAGAYYFNKQLVSISRSSVLQRGGSSTLLDFVHTLFHELIHAQSAHIFIEDEMHTSNPVAFGDIYLLKNGLYFSGKSELLDEALTELLATEVTVQYFVSKCNKNVEEIIMPAYIDYINKFFDILNEASAGNEKAQSEIFRVLVLYKFGAISDSELFAILDKYNVTEKIKEYFHNK